MNCSLTPVEENRGLELKLSDGSSESNGRVEVEINGKWGTVCSDNYYSQSRVAEVRSQL